MMLRIGSGGFRPYAVSGLSLKSLYSRRGLYWLQEPYYVQGGNISRSSGVGLEK
jgi:hypothetical protein